MNLARFFACLLVFLGFMPSADAHQVASVEFEFLKLDDQWRLDGRNGHRLHAAGNPERARAARR